MTEKARKAQQKGILKQKNNREGPERQSQAQKLTFHGRTS